MSPSGSSNLPSDFGRAALILHEAKVSVYLILQPLRFTPGGCRQPPTWALTPRFHPYQPEAGGYFLWHWLYVSFDTPFPLGSKVLCVVPTFLPQHEIANDETTCRTAAKVKKTTFVKKKL